MAVFLRRKLLLFLRCIGMDAVLQHDFQALHPGHASAPVSLVPVKGDSQTVSQGLPGMEMELIGGEQHTIQIE